MPKSYAAFIAVVVLSVFATGAHSADMNWVGYKLTSKLDLPLKKLAAASVFEAISFV